MFIDAHSTSISLLRFFHNPLNYGVTPYPVFRLCHISLTRISLRTPKLSAGGSLTDKSVLTVSTLAGGGAPVFWLQFSTTQDIPRGGIQPHISCRNGSRTHTIQLMRLTDLPLVASCYIGWIFYYRFATSSTELPRQLRASILINYGISYLSLFPRIPMRAISGIYCTIGIVVWFLHSTTAYVRRGSSFWFQRYPVRVNYWQLTLTFNRGL